MRGYIRIPKSVVSLVLAGLVLGAGYVTVAQLPDIRRYLKMRSM